MAIVKIPDCGKGVNLDAMSEELADGMWSNCQNMRFRTGFAQRFRGLTAVHTTPSVTPYFITPFQTVSKRFWCHAGNQKVFVDDGTTKTEITPATNFTGTQDDRWSGGAMSGILYLNNGIDLPHYWTGDTATDLAPLTGWNSTWRCASMRPFKNYLIAFDITKGSSRYPHMIKWSHVALPGAVPSSWDETDVTKEAGEQDLAETPDLLVDALPMGDVLVVYKERSMYSMSFIGAPYVWRFQKLPGDHGMLTRGCAVNTPLGHVVLTAGDVVLHQGQGASSIADGVIRSFIFNNIDSTNYKRAFVTANPQRNEVLICFPMNGSVYCDKAAVWNWVDKTWGLRDLPNVTYGAFGQVDFPIGSGTWDADSETWDADASEWNRNEYAPNEARLLMTTSTPYVVAFDTGTTDLGTPFRSMLERTQMSFGDSNKTKLVRAVYPKISAGDGTVINVEVGGSMNPDDSPIWSPAQQFVVGSTHKADCLVPGRFISLRLTSTSGAEWRVRNVDVDIVVSGDF